MGKNKGNIMDKEQSQQEFLYKLSMFEKYTEQLNQQLQLIEKSLLDLNSLIFGIEELKDSTGKEVLAQLGRGIFVKTKVVSDELVVDVGNKNLVGKNIQETKKIIKEQIEKLNQIKKELEEKIKEVEKDLTDLLVEEQKKEKD